MKTTVRRGAVGVLVVLLAACGNSGPTSPTGTSPSSELPPPTPPPQINLYRGAYQSADGVIMFLFEFQGRSVGSPFNDATGTLKGDSLTVQYDWNMRMADFEDAVYVQMP